jgi:hypothetical protein
MLALWGYSGAVRTKTKSTPNEEDTRTVAKGSKLLAEDPPARDVGQKLGQVAGGASHRQEVTHRRGARRTTL